MSNNFGINLKFDNGEFNIFSGKSYNAFVNKYYKELIEFKNVKVMKDKTFGFCNIKKGYPLIVFDESKKGYLLPDTDISIPILYDNYGGVWMSITPMELLTCKNGIINAKGNVLIAGLGLALILKLVQEKEDVYNIDLYEIDNDLIDFWFNTLKISKDKINIINKSIYDAEDIEKYDFISIDIHKDFGEAYNDKALKNKFKNTNYWIWGNVKNLEYLY